MFIFPFSLKHWLSYSLRLNLASVARYMQMLQQRFIHQRERKKYIFIGTMNQKLKIHSHYDMEEKYNSISIVKEKE